MTLGLGMNMFSLFSLHNFKVVQKTKCIKLYKAPLINSIVWISVNTKILLILIGGIIQNTTVTLRQS